MSAVFVSLAQALCYLKKPTPFVDEPTFRATVSAKSMPKDAALRTALIGGLVRGELGHKASLSVMTLQSVSDHLGNEVLRESEPQIVEDDFQVSSDLWRVDNLNLVRSHLDLDHWLPRAKLNRNVLESTSWMRVINISVNGEHLEQVARSNNGIAAQGRGGRQANMAFWQEFYAEIAATLSKKGMAIDDDAEWRAWTCELRKEFTHVDESQIVKAMRALRRELRARGCLKAGFTT